MDQKTIDTLLGRDNAPETRGDFFQPVRRSEAQVDASIASSVVNETDEIIDREIALQISTVHCCIRLIAEGLAQPKLYLYRPTADGLGREEANDHTLHRLFTTHGPNPRQSTFEFFRQIGAHLAIGDAFVKVSRVGGRVVALWPIDPSKMTVFHKMNGDIEYKIAGDSRFYNEDDGIIWHIRSLSWDGAKSLKFVEAAASTLGLSRAQEQFGKRLFKNGAMARSVLTVPTDSTFTIEQRREFMNEWNRNFAGVNNAHKTPLLPGGMDLKNVSSTANEAQWMDSRRYQTEEICRFFNIRPNMVMQTGATSYASVEQEFIAHHKHTLGPLHTAVEQSATKMLLTREEREAGLVFKINSNAMLRGSTAERVAYYKAGREGGWLSANEIRRLEDLDRSTDPAADELTPAANLFGNSPQPKDGQETEDKE